MALIRDTRLNLDDDRVEQCVGDLLELSGCTDVYGTFNSFTGYQLCTSATTINIDGGNNLTFEDVNAGVRTLSQLACDSRIVSNSEGSAVSFANNGADEFITFSGSDSTFISKTLNNSGDTVSVLTRDGNHGYGTINPQEKLHIENGNIFLSGNTTGSTNIRVENLYESGNTEILLKGLQGELVTENIAIPGDTKDLYPTGYDDIGQTVINSFNATANAYAHQLTQFNAFILNGQGTLRCEVYDGSGYTGTLLGTDDISVPDNNGANRNWNFTSENISLTPNQIITFKVFKVGGGTIGYGQSTGSYTYKVILNGTEQASSVWDFYARGNYYENGGAAEAELLIKRHGSDTSVDSKYYGSSRIVTDSSLYLGGGCNIIFQTDGLVDESSCAMSDVFRINASGTLEALSTGYTSLITSSSYIPNKEYVDIAVSGATSGLSFNQLQSLSTNTTFGFDGSNEFVTYTASTSNGSDVLNVYDCVLNSIISINDDGTICAKQGGVFFKGITATFNDEAVVIGESSRDGYLELKNNNVTRILLDSNDSSTSCITSNLIVDGVFCVQAPTADNSNVLEIRDNNTSLNARFTDEGRLIYGTAGNAVYNDRADTCILLHEGNKIFLGDGINSINEIYADGKYIKIHAVDGSGGVRILGDDIEIKDQNDNDLLTATNSIAWRFRIPPQMDGGMYLSSTLSSFTTLANVIGTYFASNHEGTSVSIRTNTGEQAVPTAFTNVDRVWITTLGNIGFNGSEPTDLYEVYKNPTTDRRISVNANLISVTHNQNESDFDFRKEFYVNETLIIDGETHTITGITDAFNMGITPAHSAQTSNTTYSKLDSGLRFIIKNNNGYAGFNVTNPQERLEVSGNTRVSGEIQIGDTGTTISKDGSDNLVFKDTIAGSKTLSELLPTSGIVSVGSGGNYPDLTTAIAAGEYKIRLVSDVTEPSDVTISGKTEIDLGGYELDMGLYSINDNVSTYNLTIVNGKITYAHTGATDLFIGFVTDSLQLIVEHVTIDNNSTANRAMISPHGYFNHVRVELPDQLSGGFGGSGGDTFQGEVHNAEFVGGGTSCIYAIYNAASTDRTRATNIFFEGTWGSSVAYIKDGTNIIYAGSNDTTIILGNAVGVYDRTSGGNRLTANVRASLTNFKLKSLTAWVYASLTDGQFTTSFTLGTDAKGMKFTNIYFVDSVTVNDDEVSFVNCQVGNTNGGGKTITINAAKEKTIIMATRTETDIVDNGTNTVLLGNLLF